MIINVVADDTTIFVNQTTDITITAEETDGGDGPISVSVSAGILSNVSCSVATCTVNGEGTGTVNITAATDGDGSLGEQITITMTFLAPNAAGPVNVNACQTDPTCPPADPAEEVIIVEAGGPTEDFNPRIRMTATSEVIDCDNGSVTITADALDANGNVVPNVDFEFHTSYGEIEQTEDNEVVLTLPRAVTIHPPPINGVYSAVLATAPGFGSEVILIQVRCFVSVVVTANPNVVECGGRALITATARDDRGHVLEGVGFHFATDQGLLIVGPPNNAHAEQGAAVLQLFPPGSSNPTGSLTATVVVSVGTTLGTVEGTVTVQQYCPSSNTVAGNIALTASAPAVPCNGRVFVAGTLKDKQGHPVPDGTEITFLASAGSVSKSAVAAGPGATPSAGSGNNPSVTVTTQGGTANLIYTADAGAVGNVQITAASGNEFGSINLPVCTQVGGVTPPSTGTGVSIRPPSTGDAGLADD
jgi:hypothetical protein